MSHIVFLGLDVVCPLPDSPWFGSQRKRPRIISEGVVRAGALLAGSVKPARVGGAVRQPFGVPGFVASGFPRFAGGHVGLIAPRVEVGRSGCSDQSGGGHEAVEFLTDEPAKVVTTVPEVACDRCELIPERRGVEHATESVLGPLAIVNAVTVTERR
jgi:hypothetical protein